MDFKNLPDSVMAIGQTEYQAIRTKANSFVNRNWWWMMIACFVIGIVIGLWNPLGLGR